MAVAITRTEFDAAGLRQAATRAKDAHATLGMLALALVLVRGGDKPGQRSVGLVLMRALTPGQHEAAEKVLALHDAVGFEPRQVASYAPFGSGPGHDDDQAERHDVTRFRQLLTHASDAEDMALHGLALGDVPSVRGLAFLRRILNRLADRWGFKTFRSGAVRMPGRIG